MRWKQVRERIRDFTTNEIATERERKGFSKRILLCIAYYQVCYIRRITKCLWPPSLPPPLTVVGTTAAAFCDFCFCFSLFSLAGWLFFMVMGISIHINHCARAHTHSHTYKYRAVHKHYYLHSMYGHVVSNREFFLHCSREDKRMVANGGKRKWWYDHKVCSVMRQNSLFLAVCLFPSSSMKFAWIFSFFSLLFSAHFFSLQYFFSLEKKELFNSDNCIKVSLQCGLCLLNTFSLMLYKWISIYRFWCVCMCMRRNNREPTRKFEDEQ